jgi:5-methylcytosine-specific restriction endonuclease McrA
MRRKNSPRIRMARDRIPTASGYTAAPPKATSAAYGDEFYRERQRFLNRSQWRQISAAKRAYDPLCQACALEGVQTPAVDVDHWQPMRAIPRSRWTEYANLRSLCERHHTLKTQADIAGEPPPFACAPCTPHPLYS